MSQPTIEVSIESADEVYFSGPVTSLSSVNEKGEFDILPMHENFISLINTSIKYSPANSQSPKLVEIASGILRVRENKVEIFLGI